MLALYLRGPELKSSTAKKKKKKKRSLIFKKNTKKLVRKIRNGDWEDHGSRSA
jgi:hypothetical protein